MMAVLVKVRGSFRKSRLLMRGLTRERAMSIIDKYASAGTAALAAATPKDTGTTASAWRYEVTHSGSHVRISWYNDNVNDGVNIAVILQLGHGTGTGGWVEGRDYINPAIRPFFDKLARDTWEEVMEV